jgi:hypothetical protein
VVELSGGLAGGGHCVPFPPTSHLCSLWCPSLCASPCVSLFVSRTLSLVLFLCLVLSLSLGVFSQCLFLCVCLCVFLSLSFVFYLCGSPTLAPSSWDSGAEAPPWHQTCPQKNVMSPLLQDLKNQSCPPPWKPSRNAPVPTKLIFPVPYG